MNFDIGDAMNFDIRDAMNRVCTIVSCQWWNGGLRFVVAAYIDSKASV
ncbi:hypothetical protein [Calothrix parietina]|uniref:Uncharacterized protein n=1 Tax=Calothrix anomala FACHB-343 TaxID=2692894 RepID=A0ABR8AXN7_9CYAN|nr:hypothetical protein [Calothrix parietina]MBD2225331.1 hypothetical protein [Calothrix anomala FACHB-343]